MDSNSNTKLRCREGDMALVIGEDPGYEENIGRVVTVYGPVEINPTRGPSWLIVPASPHPWSVMERGDRKCIGHITLDDRIEHADAWLLPLRPKDELDWLVESESQQRLITLDKDKVADLTTFLKAG